MCVCVCVFDCHKISIFKIHTCFQNVLHIVLHQNKILDDCFTDVLQAMFSGSITFLFFAVLQSSKYWKIALKHDV